jgi:tetratricopeptide (TPR) repeat protein
LRQAESLFADLSRAHPGEREYENELAEACHDLGIWQVGTSRFDLGLASFRKAIDLWDKLRQELPNEAPYAISLARACDNLGDTIRRQGRPREAGAYFDRAVFLLEPVCRAPGADETARRILASAFESQARNALLLGTVEQGIAVCLKSLTLRRGLRKENPRLPTYLEDEATTLHVLALLHKKAARLDEALKTLDEALPLAEKAVADHPSLSSPQHSLASVYLNKGVIEMMRGGHARAIPSLEKGEQMMNNLALRNQSVTAYQTDQALTLSNLSVCYGKTGKHTQAAAATRAAAALLARAPQDFARVDELQEMLRRNGCAVASGMITAGQKDEGLRLFQDLQDHYRRASAKPPGGRHAEIHLARVTLELGTALSKLGREQAAARSFEEVAAALKASVDQDKGATEVRDALGRAYFALGQGFHQRNRPQEAIKPLLEALRYSEELTNALPAESKQRVFVANVQTSLGIAYLKVGDPGRAEEFLEKARQERATLAEAHPQSAEYLSDLATSHFNLSLVYRRRKENDRASQELQKGIDLGEVLLKDNPRSARYLKFLAESYGELGLSQAAGGQTEEALKSFGRELDSRRTLVSESPENWDRLYHLIHTQRKLGAFRDLAKQTDEAASAYQDAISGWQRWVGLAPPSEVLGKRVEIAEAYIGLATVNTRADRLAEAGAAYRQAQEHLEQAGASAVRLEKALTDVTTGLLRLGQEGLNKNQLELAQESFAAAEGLAQKLSAGKAGNSKYQEFLFLAQLNGGTALARAAKRGPALESFRRGSATLDQADPALPKLAEYRGGLRSNLTTLGTQLATGGQTTAALQAYREAVEIGKKMVAGRPDEVLQRRELFESQARLAGLYKRLGKHAEAEAAYRDQLTGLEAWAERQPKVVAL